MALAVFFSIAIFSHEGEHDPHDCKANAALIFAGYNVSGSRAMPTHGAGMS